MEHRLESFTEGIDRAFETGYQQPSHEIGQIDLGDLQRIGIYMRMFLFEFLSELRDIEQIINRLVSDTDEFVFRRVLFLVAICSELSGIDTVEGFKIERKTR